jgi:hypothetical protein
MRVRSTGLGNQQMVAGFANLRPVENGFIIMEMHSTEPVHWKIRVALTGADLRDLLRLIFGKPRTTLKVLRTLFQAKNEKNPPEF